jgi:hypothetical protein
MIIESIIRPPKFRFAADKSSVTLLTDPAFFLAKNQLSEKVSRIIVIPALPNSGPKNVCPVRTLLKSAGITLPRNQVKAHEVRAIASSCSIFNSASLTEILSAGF